MYAALNAGVVAPHVCRYRPTARDLARDQRLGLRDMALACLVACVCIALLVVVGHRAASGVIPVEEGVTFEQAYVESGDSLWLLAEEHPVRGMSTRQVVDLISERNGLTTSTLQPGQSILVPVASSSVLV